ncbi:MAG TPA: error-prone DNA polymerase [Gemmataceae bacterium]|nr:error-prone DNA polymerase [Gemmataceae bacterium]
MPEQPDPKLPIPPKLRKQSGLATIPYAELHCRTNFSFLEGASHPHELVERAAELGYVALAVTDRESVAGVVRAHVATKEVGLKLLIGSSVHPIDGPPMLLWVIDRAGYRKLCRLLTRGRRSAPKGECRLTFDDVAAHSNGLLAGILSRSVRSTILELWRCREVFGDRCYAVAELNRGPVDRRRLHEVREWAAEARVPLVAANDVHYHVPRRRPLHDVLTATRHGCTVAELGDRRFPNAERHLKSPEEMRELFADAPDAVTRTKEVADRCSFSLDELRYDYPEELCPAGLTPLQYLTELTWAGARRRYPTGIPDKVRGLIEHELNLIAELRYEAYFLTVWDLVRFARGRSILCQGRGSAANSAVCYCLGVTSVDPERIDVLFERFVSKDRNEAPDIDVDFEHERREEVLQYIWDKYGRERAGMTAEVISYRERSAIRDVGKALGLSLERVDLLAKTMDHHPRREEMRLASRLEDGGLDSESRLTRQLLWLVHELLGFPRHLSQHVGGMVMTNGPLCELVPIENAAMPDRTVVQWDKDDLDALGILKVDCLALGMLTAIRKCFDLLDRHHGQRWELATVPAEDPVVYDMVCHADTIGVFQIESRAQMSMLPRLRPREFYDLVIEVAIVRPGPIQGKMVHPYLRRRQGKESVEFPSEAIREVLSKTLGVPIFQEQAMRLAVVAAGFTPGEADQLRRAMGVWRKSGVMGKFQAKLINGMLERGYPREFAERVYQQICGFGEYGFPESHAASFALLVYVSAWLKCHHPAAFAAALLNSQPMGFYGPAQLVGDARKHGVEVRPIDVNFSEWDCTLEPGDRSQGSGVRGQESEANLSSLTPDSCLLTPALRLGFRLIGGLNRKHADNIVESRGDGRFQRFSEFIHRTGLRAAALKRLSQADAFGSLQMDRQSTLWRALPERGPRTTFDANDRDEAAVSLPPLTPLEEVLADYWSAGLTLRQHPISFFRRELESLGIAPAERLFVLDNDRRVIVAGVVLLRQRPSTAKGITFVTLEDETGTVNLIVRMEVWEKYRRVARTAVTMIAHGLLQKEGEVIHVLVSRLEDMSAKLADLAVRSRDFH